MTQSGELKMKRILICGVFTVFAGIYGTCAYASHGNSGAEFLTLGVGAREIAMGEAATALAEGGNALYWNPAILADVRHRSLSTMHAFWLEGIFFDYVGYLESNRILSGHIGGALTLLSSGRIEKYDNTGTALGTTYSHTDIALIAGYGRKLGDFDVGGCLKGIYSKIDSSNGMAVALDAGMLYKKLSYKGMPVELGAVIRNIGSNLKYESQGDPLPAEFAAGAGVRIWQDSLRCGTDIRIPFYGSISCHIGAEYAYRAFKGIILMPRAGFKTTLLSDIGILSGMSLGLGVQESALRLDYAWVPYGYLGNTHRISFNIGF